MTLRTWSVAQIRQLLAGGTADPRLLRALARDPRAGVRQLVRRVRAQQAREARRAARWEDLAAVERRYRRLGFTVIAGVDEAGVAPLAGPVVAAAVVLPPEARWPDLDDSKRLPPVRRDALYARIMTEAVAVAAAQASVEEIDALNILQATRLAHRRAVEALSVRPHLVLLDGRYPADLPVPQAALVDGDARCACIAAASVVAKVTRDRLMRELDAAYPPYGFARHKGYPTREHLEAIRRWGPSPVHRRSFSSAWERQEVLAMEISG
ncbi:MAG: ribonuclease HII [Armatimonadota bacterium]|nr:ribonuclease HII [Armatimonadota bacterium]MDR7404893.1 ribonuclease HII [Armatimonadota bacterium]